MPDQFFADIADIMAERPVASAEPVDPDTAFSGWLRAQGYVVGTETAIEGPSASGRTRSHAVARAELTPAAARTIVAATARL